MTGYLTSEMDEPSRSAVAELANMICGRALAAVRRRSWLSPPVVFVGSGGSLLSMFNMPLFVVSLETNSGDLELQVAVTEAAAVAAAASA